MRHTTSPITTSGARGGDGLGKIPHPVAADHVLEAESLAVPVAGRKILIPDPLKRLNKEVKRRAYSGRIEIHDEWQNARSKRRLPTCVSEPGTWRDIGTLATSALIESII